MQPVQTPTPPVSRPAPPAGWYKNPGGPGERYWDGEKWTDSYAKEDPQPAVVQPTPSSVERDGEKAGTFEIVGYIMAVLIPFVGFIMGIIGAAQRRKHGVWIIVVSVVAFVIWLALISASYDTTSSYSTY